MSKWAKLMPKPRSRFLRVKCPDCGSEQIVFDSATIVVKCNICDGILAEPRGGKAELRGEIIGVLD